VIVGEYAGWTPILAFGFGNAFVSTILITILFWGFTLCEAELIAQLPFAGGASKFLYPKSPYPPYFHY